MRRIGIVWMGGCLLYAGVSAASLEIYRDGAKYRYVPVEDYVGFVRGASARCGDRKIDLVVRRKCPEAKRLCKARHAIDRLTEELRKVRASADALERWIASARPGEVDAARWISAAERAGKRLAEWRSVEQRNAAALSESRKRFDKEASASEARYLSVPCKETLELTLPSGAVVATLLNTAKLMDGRLQVDRILSFRNRSGVDISSKDVRVYARNLRQSLRPVRFVPQSVRLRAGGDHASGKKPEAEAVGPTSTKEKNRQNGYRHYAVGHIDLPSTGEEVRVSVERYEVPMRCGLLSYPWKDPTVYRVCRFAPKTPVQSDRWILKRGGRVIGEEAYGTYDRGRYLLYVGRDAAVEIRRRPLAKGKHGGGISGGKVRRRDGFVLEVANRSDRQKTVRIVERIPRSLTKKVRVRLLKVEGAVRESLDEEEGRLVMQAVMAPGEEKRITVLYELVYDKALSVVY